MYFGNLTQGMNFNTAAPSPLNFKLQYNSAHALFGAKQEESGPGKGLILESDLVHLTLELFCSMKTFKIVIKMNYT